MLKVLFVDNDATIRIIAKKAIEDHWECKVLLAASGAEGLKLAAKEPPQLILLDVLMPGLDGVQTLKRLREQGAEAPAIFVTAKEDTSQLFEQNKEYGVVAVIKKPFVPRTLLEECSKILDKKS
jgi:CheY-like chemotaxis protein